MIKRALVLGRDDNVWKEMERAKALAQFHVIIAVKRAGRDYDGVVHHWVGLHPNLIDAWIPVRQKHNRPPAQNYWAGGSIRSQNDYSVPFKWLPNLGGSSGLLGVQVALLPELGIHKIVLCGMPMDKTNRYDDDKCWEEAHVYRPPWQKMKKRMRQRVRSMSGWTQELLGPVTKEWLYDLPERDNSEVDSSRAASA